MKNIQQRINNAVGQLNGISHMIENQRDCFDILAQMKAARSSIEAVMEKYVAENFLSCLGSCGKQDQERIKKLLIELTKKN
jgi:DNA-binding FrmR family transcriptional regulator